MIPPFHWWRTVFFLIPCISVYTLVLGALSIGSSVFRGTGDFAHRCARAWSWLILATTGVQVTVDGRQHLPRDGACVFVANHQSIYDIPIVFWTLPYQLRIIAKDSLLGFPVLGAHLARSGHVLVDRRSSGTRVLARITGLMERGVSLMVFPEGTRSRDGTVGRFRGGVFLPAIQAGLSIVPVSLSGSRHVMKKGRLMTCPGRVHLTVHAMISTESLGVADARSLASRVHAIVAAAVMLDDEPSA